MGIEPAVAPLPRRETNGFAVSPILKCNWRVKFLVTWGHVRIRGVMQRPAWRTEFCLALEPPTNYQRLCCASGSRYFDDKAPLKPPERPW